MLCMIVIPAGSTIENQVCWLFDINEAHSTFQYRDIVDHNVQVDYAVRYILEELGVEVEDPQVDYLDTILEPFLQTGFPSTVQFSRVARSTLITACPIEQPDYALIAWMEHEERLFKRLERHIIAKVLESGFSDVEGFLRYSLSVQNRRKARVGQALENHLEEIFLANQIRYTRGAITENKAKPDFVFPCIDAYRDSTFSDNKLTMLGVKSTCKDRWRQVLTEAKRIHAKHLLTLEPAISLNQTAEMQANSLQLVLPSKLHETYADQQRKWLLTLQGFIMLLRERQSNRGYPYHC
ncbi:MAG: restriction enzyme C terminal [Bacillota bacterium]|nr:MAG: restriction enzyme C terminal [Bacillota bacterium]